MRARRDIVRVLVDGCRPGVVCLQETKLATVAQGDLLSILGTDFTELAYLPVFDTRGGVLIAARGTLVTISDPHISVFSL
jgi:hypothetical protein